MNASESYLLCVVLSCIARIVYHKLAWKICAHSNSGGTEYSYVPMLLAEYSVMMDREFGYAAQNKRVKILTWVLLPVFPVYWIVQALMFTRYALLRAEHFFTYGKISTSVPKEAYEHERIGTQDRSLG